MKMILFFNLVKGIVFSDMTDIGAYALLNLSFSRLTAIANTAFHTPSLNGNTDSVDYII